jgi:MFS family permease
MSGTTVALDQTQAKTDQVAEKTELDVAPLKANFWLAIMTMIYTLDFADRFLIAATLPAIKKEFMLTDAAAGLLGGVLYFSIFALVVPCGILVDRWSRKYVITIMVSIWSAATFAPSLAGKYLHMLLALLGVGVGEAGYNPASYALIGAYFPQSKRASKVGVFIMGQTFGAILGFGVAGIMAQHWGWRSVYQIFAIPGFVLAFMMLFAPDYKTVKVEAGTKKAGKVSIKETFKYILSTRTLLLLIFAQAPIFFWIVGYSIWVPSFFVRGWDLNLAQAGQLIIIIALCYCLGPFFGGRLSDKLSRGKPQGRITAALICLSVPILFYSIGFFGGYRKLSLYLVCGALSVAQFFYTGHYSTLVAAALDLVPIPFRETCQSLLVIFQCVVGFFAGAVIGALSDHLGLMLAMWIVMIVCLGLALIALAASYKTYRLDYEKKDSLGKFELEVA